MRRRAFITLLGGAAAWPLVASAQQPAMPVIGFLSGRSLASDANLVAAFRQGLGEGGYLDAQNVTIDFRWADGQLDRLPALAAELIERKVAVIFAGASDVAAGALRVAAATVPVVLATGSDPVASGATAYTCSRCRMEGRQEAMRSRKASRWGGFPPPVSGEMGATIRYFGGTSARGGRQWKHKGAVGAR